MRVLIVEDDEPLAEALAARIRGQLPLSGITVTHSLAEGMQAIDSDVFDAAVIDLRLPSERGAGDAAIENGLAIEGMLAADQPGVLRLFVTASEAEVVVEQLQRGKFDDFFACNEEFCVVEYIRKDGIAALDRCTERIVAHATRLQTLDAVELEGAADLPLDAQRALAITVRLAGAHHGRVLKRVGLSGALTALVECLDESDNPAGNAFCKCGPPEAIQKELEGYRLAEFQLDTTAFPTLARELSVGIGVSRGLIFTKAPSGTTFFDLAVDDPATAANYVDKLPAVLKPWRDRALIEAIRFQTLIDEVLTAKVAATYAEPLETIDLGNLGELDLHLLRYCQHGDLHGANLFVASGNAPFLIDFALTGPKFGPVDHVSLELGLLFHPDSPFRGRLTAAECDAWLSDEATQFDGLGPIITACRRWAETDGHDLRAHAAATLLYAVWILNHTDQGDQAIAISGAAARALRL